MNATRNPVGDHAKHRAELAKAKAEEAKKPKPVKVKLVSEVVRTWMGNPLIHEPTGLARLDELTGGGPVYGSRWYVLGAPDAGKTMLIVQMADTLARRGIIVGVLAVDEEADDVVTRLAQRLGRFRRDCEIRSDALVEDLARELEGLGIYIYDPEETVERAAEHLAAVAKRRGTRAALFIDSVQAVASNAVVEAERDLSVRERVSNNVRAIRTVATEHRMLVVSTSEMNRAAYRNIEEAEQDDMAAGKESGAIEYSARVMIALRRASDEGDLVVANVVKNKHGPSYVQFHLGVNKATQTLADAADPEPKDETDSPDFIRACAAVHQIIIDNPKMNKSTLAAYLIEAGFKLGQAKREAALKRLVKQGKVEVKLKTPDKPNAGYILVPLVLTVAEPIEPTKTATVNGAGAMHTAAQDTLFDVMDGP